MRRKRILSAPQDPLLALYLANYVDAGFRIVRQDEFSADLIKRKRFSLLALLVFQVLYLIYYWAKSDSRISVFLQRDGTIEEVRR
jgi:hypothetical protein